MCNAEGSQTGLFVLVVEDEADTAESLAMLLGFCGHQARVARDGWEALQMAAAFAPDVVLLDIGLPKLDGYTVAERLHQQSNARRPLLIAVTGYGQESDRRRSLEAGIDVHLLKPADPEVLAGLLRQFGQNLAAPERAMASESRPGMLPQRSDGRPAGGGPM